jgi:hypothetical protein
MRCTGPAVRRGRRLTTRRGSPCTASPENIGHFVDDCLAHTDLSARQRSAVRGEVLKMLHDIRFLRMLTNEARARGPWSAEAVHPSDEGRVL